MQIKCSLPGVSCSERKRKHVYIGWVSVTYLDIISLAVTLGLKGQFTFLPAGHAARSTVLELETDEQASFYHFVHYT